MEAQYLRARWYDVATGRFTSRDPWEGDIYNPETRNGFDYANDNPILFTDPLGLCTYGEPNYIECMQLARLLARAYGQPVGDATGTYDEKYHQYSNLSYNSLQNLWVSLDPVHSQNRYDVVEQEAKRFALPPEFIAAVIAAEVEYDTDWINSVYDVWTTCLDWSQPDCLPLNPFARLHMELWYDYYGLGPLYLNPEHGFGEGPAPGIGNVHVGVAAGAEQYFATNYPDEDLLPIARTKARRLELLRRYKWNVRYVAAYLRQLADTRTGRKGPHLDLTDTDMKMIFVAYHADLAYCFGEDPDPVRNFQDKQSVSRPECKRFADQLGPFLSLYRSGK